MPLQKNILLNFFVKWNSLSTGLHTLITHAIANGTDITAVCSFCIAVRRDALQVWPRPLTTRTARHADTDAWHAHRVLPALHYPPNGECFRAWHLVYRKSFGDLIPPPSHHKKFLYSLQNRLVSMTKLLRLLFNGEGLVPFIYQTCSNCDNKYKLIRN